MTPIERAKSQAQRLDETGYTHPAYERVALRGILNALIAIHDQQATPPAPRRTPTKKAADK